MGKPFRSREHLRMKEEQNQKKKNARFDSLVKMVMNSSMVKKAVRERMRR